jgi:hypothetical protein
MPDRRSNHSALPEELVDPVSDPVALEFRELAGEMVVAGRYPGSTDLDWAWIIGTHDRCQVEAVDVRLSTNWISAAE